MTSSSKFRTGLCAGIFLTLPALAQAVVTLPFGDAFLNGTLDMGYAISGSARIDPVLYVDSNENFGPGALAAVYAPPGTVAGGTGLGFGYDVSGAGTGALEVVYSITNNTGLAWTGLRFFIAVSGDPFDSLSEIPTIAVGATDSGDPAGWGADDFQTGDLFLNDILTAVALDGANHCGANACAAEVGLQWNLDALPDGATWLIRVLLSDEGTTVGNVALALQLADEFGTPLAPGEALHVSGTAIVVPLPGALALLLGAVPPLFAFGRRRPAGTMAG